MARIEYNRHKRIAVTADDGVSDVQPQRDWNGDAHEQVGFLGFDNVIKTLASDAFVASDTLQIVAAETGISDNLATITQTDSAINDWLILFADAGDTITVKHGTGNIQLQGSADKALSETIPMLLIRRGTTWYEFGSGSNEFLDSLFKIKDNSDTTKQLVAELSEMTAGKTLTIKSRVTVDTTVYAF